METPAALLWVRLAVPLAPAIWAGLLALGEEAAVGEALQPLGYEVRPKRHDLLALPERCRSAPS